jgi:cell division septation protein DedD
MKHFISLAVALCIVSFVLFAGCSSSDQTAEKTETPPPPPAQVKTPAENPPPVMNPTDNKKIDTLKVDVKDITKPAYEPKEVPPPPPGKMPTGNFSVQIGAYKMPDNADRIASLAKERFSMTVYTVVDRADNLYKVMIGDFNSKDEARNFRDEMANKFTSDYKDAWVSENPQK